MISLLRTNLETENEAIQKQIRDFFTRLSSHDIDGTEYIKDTSLDFCKKQKLKEAILKSVDLLQSSSYGEIKSVIDDALKLGIDSDHGHDYKKDFEARYEIKSRNPVSTDWRNIDRICKNGLGKGELGVCIAATGSGKSMALVHLGAAALKAGKNVVHYTLELSEEVIGLRYDSCLSKIPLNDLYDLKDRAYETCMEVEGELFIKEYPTKTATPRTISKAMEKLKKRGHAIDLIIVDYAALLRPSSTFREKRNELESIYEELRSAPLLGKSFYVPNPPEEYLTLKYGPNWRIPKEKGFEADIIDSIPESINLSKSSLSTRVSKFLFPKKYLTRIQILSPDLRPIPNMEVAIVGFSKQITDHNGNIMFKISDEGDYALAIGSGEAREILYEEVLEPGKEYTYIQDANEKQGRLHVLQEKT